MTTFTNKEYNQDDLKNLFHNDHQGTFEAYLANSRHTRNKHSFLLTWIRPTSSDYILECGSSSGKTCIDLSLHSGCRCLGIDFDEEAIKVSQNMLKLFFPGLSDQCRFEIGDLTNMNFDKNITKVIMPDFSEHIPDTVFKEILTNIKKQFSQIHLYIYTPNRSHIFEHLKHNNILLKNTSGHINVKNENQLISFLKENGWEVTSKSWHSSSMLYVKPFELLLSPIPYIGSFFKRRIAIIARPI